MNAYLFALTWLHRLNSLMIRIGAGVAWICVTFMVAAILVQVLFRYGFNAALPWPEEVARAFMIWMMALVAAGAYREGSFVAIEMLHDYLPRTATRILKIFLFVCALLVLYHLFVMGLDFFQRGFRSRAASFDMPRAWIYLAMPVCFGSMLLVNVELLMKEVGLVLFRNFADRLPAYYQQRAVPAVSE